MRLAHTPFLPSGHIAVSASREDIRIVRFADRYDPRVVEFCRQVAIENGADEEYFARAVPYNQVRERFAGLPDDQLDEVWRFGPYKWRETKFDNLQCLVLRDRIVGVSGCRTYANGLLRVCMHLYTLREFRGLCHGMQFAPDGVFAHHLEYARSRPEIRSLFMTVYPHTRKLRAHARNLAQRKLSALGAPMSYVRDLRPWPVPVRFHGVDQQFFFYVLDANFQFDGQAPLPMA